MTEVSMQAEEGRKRLRYREGRWCSTCKKEIPAWTDPCSVCGGSFMNGTLYPWAVLEEEWIPVDFVWYKPSTWSKGYWGNTKLHRKQ